MLKVLLLAGGTSNEREVSLRSGKTVKEALEKAGHHVTMLDTADGLNDADFEGYDAIFPVLHGAGGEDGELQARLESLSITHYVGSNTASSELCFNKWHYRQLMEEHGITIASGDLIEDGAIADHPLTNEPFVVKPQHGGSSVDTFIVRDISTANFAAMSVVHEKHGSLLIESLIDGTEITVGVVGEEALPVIEIIPPEGGEFDYENKYNGRTQELCPPVNVSADIQKIAQDLAVKIHKLCGCRDFSRTDMFVTEDGQLYVLETNTIPGMTDQSLLPKAAAAAGITMPELCSRLVEAAARRTA